MHAAFWDRTDVALLHDTMRIDTSYVEPFLIGMDARWERGARESQRTSHPRSCRTIIAGISQPEDARSVAQGAAVLRRASWTVSDRNLMALLDPTD